MPFDPALVSAFRRQAASCVVTSPKSKAKDKKDSLKVATWAAEQISSKYKVTSRCRAPSRKFNDGLI